MWCQPPDTRSSPRPSAERHAGSLAPADDPPRISCARTRSPCNDLGQSGPQRPSPVEGGSATRTGAVVAPRDDARAGPGGDRGKNSSTFIPWVSPTTSLIWVATPARGPSDGPDRSDVRSQAFALDSVPGRRRSRTSPQPCVTGIRSVTSLVTAGPDSRVAGRPRNSALLLRAPDRWQRTLLSGTGPATSIPLAPSTGFKRLASKGTKPRSLAWTRWRPVMSRQSARSSARGSVRISADGRWEVSSPSRWPGSSRPRTKMLRDASSWRSTARRLQAPWAVSVPITDDQIDARLSSRICPGPRPAVLRLWSPDQARDWGDLVNRAHTIAERLAAGVRPGSGSSGYRPYSSANFLALAGPTCPNICRPTGFDPRAQGHLADGLADTTPGCVRRKESNRTCSGDHCIIAQGPNRLKPWPGSSQGRELATSSRVFVEWARPPVSRPQRGQKQIQIVFTGCQ